MGEIQSPPYRVFCACDAVVATMGADTFDLNLDASAAPIHQVRPLAQPFPRLGLQCRFHNSRHERRGFALGRQRRYLARLPAPREHLLWRQAVPPSNLGNDRAWSKCLFDYTRLKVFSEPAPSTSPRDHLQPANGRHFLPKLMVKRRHKPISDSKISTLHHHPASKQGGVKTALTDLAPLANLKALLWLHNPLNQPSVPALIVSSSTRQRSKSTWKLEAADNRPNLGSLFPYPLAEAKCELLIPARVAAIAHRSFDAITACGRPIRRVK
jgi:hypothetical protein